MVRKLWFYNPPDNKTEATVEFMAHHTDVVCMTMGEEREKYLRDMRAAGFQGEIWLYWLQNSVHMADQPNRNNVGYRAGTYTDLKTRVPDVFQKKPNGDIVRKDDKQDYVVCDVAHPEWQKLFRERTAETVNRSPGLWTGVWDDDLNVIFFVNGVGPTKTLKYGDPDSPAYFEAFKGWLQYERDQVAAPLGLRFGGNLQGDNLTRWDEAAKIMSNSNPNGAGVVMNEFQFLSYNGGYLSVDEWKKDLAKVEIATHYGAEVWNVAPIQAKVAHEQPDGEEAQKITFFLASHLLAADERAAVRIGRDYGLAYYFPILDEVDQLGQPLGAYTQTIINGIDEYTRKFEGGYVTVRPAEKFAQIEYVPVSAPTEPEPPSDPEVPGTPGTPIDMVTLDVRLTVPESRIVEMLNLMLETTGIKIEPL
ncbi:MAG TPA: putative glycoside hydrolase [Phototrophicaceae bacterium]|jgi:hypothetical protein|nr:putative glycoside hydrolase [Phototrophicaceae bacterium]